MGGVQSFRHASSKIGLRGTTQLRAVVSADLVDLLYSQSGVTVVVNGLLGWYLTESNKEIKEGMKDMKDELAKVNTRIDEVNTRIDGVNGRIDGFNTLVALILGTLVVVNIRPSLADLLPPGL